MINGFFGGQSDDAFLRDYENVQNFIRVFYEGAGAAKPYDIRFHTATVGWVLAQTCADLSHLPKPSIFKKAAQFTLNFVIHNPITTELPATWYPSELPRRDFQNALLAFEICRASMHEAVVHGCDGQTRQLTIPITPSRHQMTDILKCLSSIQRVEESFDSYARLLALLYESLAYEFNPKARYTPGAENDIAPS